MVHEEILDQLERFYSAEISEQSLEDWMLTHLQRILDSRDEEAIKLANELDALFIEQGEDLLSKEQLLAELRSIHLREASTVRIEAFINCPPVSSSSNAQRTVFKNFGNSPEISLGALKNLAVPY